MLELGKDLFDRIQVGRVFWQEEELGADRTDKLANCFAPVAAEVIQDNDIASRRTFSGDKALLTILLALPSTGWVWSLAKRAGEAVEGSYWERLNILWSKEDDADPAYRS